MKSESNVGSAAKADLIVIEPLARKYWDVAGYLYFFVQLTASILQEKKRNAI